MQTSKTSKVIGVIGGGLENNTTFTDVRPYAEWIRSQSKSENTPEKQIMKCSLCDQVSEEKKCKYILLGSSNSI